MYNFQEKSSQYYVYTAKKNTPTVNYISLRKMLPILCIYGYARDVNDHKGCGSFNVS